MEGEGRRASSRPRRRSRAGALALALSGAEFSVVRALSELPWRAFYSTDWFHWRMIALRHVGFCPTTGIGHDSLLPLPQEPPSPLPPHLLGRHRAPGQASRVTRSFPPPISRLTASVCQRCFLNSSYQEDTLKLYFWDVNAGSGGD